MDKKSQMTLFIVLAISMLLVIVLVLSIASQIKNQELEKEAQDIVDNALSKTAMENYVTSCLNSVSREGIIKLEKQSGMILFDQKGSLLEKELPFFFYTDIYDETHKVTFAITPEQDDVPFIYPCPINRTLEDSCGANELGFSDEDTYDRIYNRIGCIYQNDEDFPFTGQCHFGRIVLPRTGLLKNSLSEQLENYVKENIESCANLSYFNDTLGFDLEVKKPNVSVSFGDEDVNVDMTYPIGVKMHDKVGYAYSDYQVVVPTRLKTIYRKIIFSSDSPFKKEIRYLDNELEEGLNDYFLKTGMDFRAEVKRSVVGLNDLVIIKDLSQNRDQPKLYFFGIQNRAPALDYINNSDEIDYDISASPGKNLILEPSAHDPDEDFLTFEYHGWKADYDCYVDEDGKCKKKDISETRWRDPEDDSLRFNKAKGHALLEISQDDKDCLDALNDQLGDCPSVISNGKRYFMTNLTVSDGALIDRQDILIDIDYSDTDALPVIKPLYDYAFENNYDPVEVFSLEDPYTLEQKSSGVLSGTELTWEFIGEAHSITTKKLCTLLPLESLCPEEITIGNIPIEDIDEDMKKYFSSDSLPKPGEIRLSTDSGNSKTEEVQVVECIPHRSDIAPWPFTPAGKDPYLGNHSCCGDDFMFKDEGDLCYDGERVVCGDSTTSTTSEKNDFLKITTAARCSGDRGNICSGDKTEDVLVYQACGDKTNTGDIATCSACTDDPDEYEEVASEVNPTCVFFEKEHSFEKDVLYEKYPNDITQDPDVIAGYCNPYTACSSGAGAGNYGEGGALECKAMCNGLTGECDYAVDCVCSKAGADMDGCAEYVDERCDGLRPFENLGTCQEAGEPYYEDTCLDDCRVGDDDDYFSCDGTETGTDCIACDIECDGRSEGDIARIPGSKSGTCKVGETFFLDSCDPEGKLVDVNNNLCAGKTFGDDCTADDQCDGVYVGEVSDNAYIDPETGQISNFAVTCNEECQPEKSEICTMDSYQRISNHVDEQCHRKEAGTALGCYEYGEPYIADVCDENCQVVEDPEGRCAYGPGCTADQKCDGKLPGETWDGDDYPGKESGCNANCKFEDCGAYNFNPENKQCYTSMDVTYDDSDEETKAEKYCNDPAFFKTNILAWLSGCEMP